MTWRDCAKKQALYCDTGLVAWDIEAVQVHETAVEVGTHCPVERVLIDGTWCPVNTLLAQVFVDGEWRNLFKGTAP